jgi:hypothetical protein
VRCLKSDAGPTDDKPASAVARASTANGEGTRWVPEAHKDAREPSNSEHAVRYADPGYQADGQKRYPIDTERQIRAAWSRINIPANANRYTQEQLRRVREVIIAAWKESIASDGPPSADDRGKATRAPEKFDTTASAADAERAASRQKDRSDPQQRAETVIKAKHSRADQALLDMAHFACDQCLKIGGLSVDEQANMERARQYLQQAGAMPARLWTVERAEDDDGSSDLPECHAPDTPGVDVVKALGAAGPGSYKRERAHQNLMYLAHECLKALTDGGVCEQAAKSGARHAQEMMELFNASHRYLIAAGARCSTTDLDDSSQPVRLPSGVAARATAKAAALPNEHSETEALKVIGEVLPMIERLSKRVDEIARTPLPPLTMAKGTVSISKQQDRESNNGAGHPELSSEAIAAGLAKMSKEEQTLTLIKASHAAPIRIPGSAADQR